MLMLYYKRASILKIESIINDLIDYKLIIKMDGLLTLFNAKKHLPNLELCWIQFQLLGPIFLPLFIKSVNKRLNKLQDPPQTPLHLYFQ